MRLDQNALSRIDIHTLSRLYPDQFKGSQPFDLHLLILKDTLRNQLHQKAQETLGLLGRATATLGQQIGQILYVQSAIHGHPAF